MAVMSSADRAECWTDHMRTFTPTETISISKVDLRVALDAVDQWVSDNAVSYNNALPAAAKANLTASQKSRLLTWVLQWRYQKGT